MMILVMKNELRNPGKDYMGKIRGIFTDPEVKRRVSRAPLASQP